MSLKGLYDTSLSDENREQALVHLSKRGIKKLSQDIGYVRIYGFDADTVISDSFLFYCFSLSGDLSQVETRSVEGKSFDKLYRNFDFVPVWNLHSVLSSHTVILTESVIDAESFNQFEVEGVTAISCMTASLNISQKVFLNFLLRSKKVFVAFDRDSIGVDRSTSFLKFSSERFGNDFRILDYLYKDLNDFLVNKPSLFLGYILKQL